MDVHGAFSEGVVKPPFANRFPGTADQAYVESVGQASFEIDHFIQRLSHLPGWDDTLYVITSDHGQGLFDHPDVSESRLHGQLLYESHIAVPLILYHPKSAAMENGNAAALPPGTVIERPVRLLDVAPTLLDFAGIAIPKEMEGFSLLPLLAGGDVALPPAFVVETEYRDREKIGAYGANYNFIANRAAHEGVGPRELQRARQRANGRRTDVSERYPKIAEKLAAYLERWERLHPKTPPTCRTKSLSSEELDQLRALGYLP
jgi:arylsulfatase A-like enzyme